jgi:XTP/dITP diphosphohydrolase
VLASNNAGKLAELQAMFAPLGIELVRQADLDIPEAPEPHRTFIENALAKARHASALSGLPAMADDAGLCVDAFGGLPGVDTAYYAPSLATPRATPTTCALLEQLQGQSDRRAAMVSTLVAVRSADDPEPLVSQRPRQWPDCTEQPVGDNGFGFDPVMWIPEFGQHLRPAAQRGQKRQQPPRPRRAAPCWP